MGLMVTNIVLTLFTAGMMFSEPNNPFKTTPAALIDPATGKLLGEATAWGMNPLLQHWAMIIHPPTLFIGYAGLTIPFAFAIAALIVNDGSKKWVEIVDRITIFSWLFLGIGIGLGSIWAYVVLGWGGYWAWDPVENASAASVADRRRPASQLHRLPAQGRLQALGDHARRVHASRSSSSARSSRGPASCSPSTPSRPTRSRSGCSSA